VEELKKAEKTVNTITLSPLGLSDTNQLIADTLHCTTERSRSLTELINRKTQGNPFFITQFLKALHEGGQITFNSEQGYWECDIAQINALSLTDNVVEFMAQQLQKLPNETKEVLKLAACIGNKFDLANLAVVWEQSQAQTATALWRALQEGLIIPQNQVYKFYLNHDQTELNIGNIENAAYRFLHDRVQQAAYNLIPEAQKQATHLKVGQLLLKNITVKEREQKIFDIVNQLNYGVQLITEPREKEELAWLNLSASSKARVSTAYTAATEYATFGIKLLKADCWQTQYQLALELHNLAAEAAYLAGKFELMAELIQTVLDSVSDPLDKTKVYEVKIEAYGSQNQALEAVCTGKEILQLLGIEFPDKPSDSEVKGEIIKTIELFNDKQIEDLIYLPLMADKTSLAAIKILSIITTFAYQIDTNIFILISLKQVSLSLQYGNSPYSSFAYGSYGIILCQLVKDVESGYRFGRLSVNLLSQFDTKEVTAKILNVFNSLIKHWREHIQETLQPLLESYSIGLETGDLQYASISIYYYHAHLYFLGQELGTLGTSTQIYINSLQKIKQNRLAHYIGILRQNILNLLGSVDDVCFLKGEAYDETVRLPISLANNDISELLVFYFYKLQLSYLFYKYDIAQKYAEKAEFYLSGGLAQVVLRQCYFYASLARLGIFLSVNEEAQAQLLNQVIDNQEKMEMWAKYCPMNVLHQYYLVEAEKNRVLGKNYEAGNWYDRAIAAAKENGYIQEEALANELAARFYLSWRREKLAADYMQEAYQCYTRWGAKAKLTHLEQQYPQLLQAIVEPTMTNFAPSTSSGQNLWLDLPAVMKAAQAISQEIELEKLLATLMHITIANAGAQIGHLALYQEGKWLVVAKADCQQVDMLEIPLEQYQEIPQSLIYVVVRTHQTAVFENLTDSAQFASDNYIITHHPKSVMCTPISRQGQLIGILYLENNLTVGAFTSDRIEILQLLTSQAAISVENARLYQQTENYAQTLETEVERKTQALNQKAQDLEQTLKQLQQTQGQLIHSEKMSSLGQMVAGIAHEINNPVSFIRGNITHLDSYIEDILRLLILYQQEYPQPSQAIQAMREEIDLDFLYEDVNQILESMKVGSERISQIVLSLRNFSRLDEAEIKAVDLHSGIQSTLLILQHRLLASGNQPEVRVIKEYGNIPLVNCYPSQLNQVFFNIIHNAIDAIRDNPQSSQNPEIRIRTEVIDNERLRIAISNTDSTIPVNLQDRIFDPFFTTKPVGRGKGLGLFVSYSIIQQHGGTLTVRSQIADGTEFKIVLPIR
ncbi:trifunctional serine/threonine-protein kinase/ATP-binding protein/sensor histidine kinase, partial [Aetokthonos hydrillicola]